MARRLSTPRCVLWLSLLISAPHTLADTIVLLQPDIEQHRIDPYTADGLPRQIINDVPLGYRATESGALVSNPPAAIEYGALITSLVFFCPPPGRQLTRCEITRTPPATSSSVGDGVTVFPAQPDGSPACCAVDEQISAGDTDDFAEPISACVIALYDDGTTERHDCYEYAVEGAPAPPPDPPEPPPVDIELLAANNEAATGGSNAANAVDYIDSQPAGAAGDRAVTTYIVQEQTRWTGVRDYHCAVDAESSACSIAEATRYNYELFLRVNNWCLSGQRPSACPTAGCSMGTIDAWGTAQPAGGYPTGWTEPASLIGQC